MKNNSGFSLVELIVVIAIMAILAGVAVPTYSKYIAKANDAKVTAELDELKTAALSAGAEKGVVVDSISLKITNKKAAEIKTDEATVTSTEIGKYLTAATDWQIDFTGTSYESVACVKWENGKWTEAAAY